MVMEDGATPERAGERGLWSFKVKADAFPDWHVQPDTADAVTDETRRVMLDALAFKRMAFHDLRDAMEGKSPRHGRRLELPPEARPSWDNPFVHVRIEYPLSDNEAFAVPATLTDKAEAMWWIGARLHEERQDKDRVISALQTLTRLAAIVRRDGEYNPVIPHPLFDAYDAMTDAEKEEFVREWFSPVTHGDGYHEEDGRPLPGEDASVEVRDGARVWRAAMVFEVYPLLLDLDGKQCFYVLRAGLPWAGDMGSPETWTATEREALWTALDRSFEATADFYRGITRTLPEAVEVQIKEASLPTWLKPSTASAPVMGWIGEEEAREAVISPQEAQATFTATAAIVNAPGRISTGSMTPPRIFPVAFGTSRADRTALDFVQHAHRLRLPRSWSKLKRWDDLVREEADAYLDRLGPDAFKDRRAETQDPNTYARLKKVYVAGKKDPEVTLTPEAEKRLRERHGDRGFLDRDPRGREAIYRCVPDARGNLMEVWLSWENMAGPLVTEWRSRQKKAVLAQFPQTDAPLLFEDLDEPLRRRLNRELERLNLYEHGRVLMEVLLGVVGKYRRNPVELPAEAFRTLLWPRGDVPKDWKETVERTLSGLRGLTGSWRAGAAKGEGAFVAEWAYHPRGRGGHGDGIFTVGVTKTFLGCLNIFETAGTRLRSGVDAVVYDYGKELAQDDKKRLAFVVFDAGRPFYHAAAGLTPTQRNLMHWLEHDITLRRDTAARSHRGAQVKPNHADAGEPRLYDNTFCPLLPTGRQFVGALGHFRRNPEAGRTLYGTARKGGTAEAGKTSGRSFGHHVDGLVAVAGYPLPSGGAHQARRDVVRQTLEDLKAVVVDYLGGVIVGRLKDKEGEAQWLPLDRFTELDEDTLCRRLTLFPFLPPDWNQRRRDHFEEVTGYRATESIEEAEAAAWGTAAPPALAAPAGTPENREAEAPMDGTIFRGPEDGWRGLSLPSRLHAAMTYRGLKRTDLARIFGVTKGAVTQWLYGLKVDEDPNKAVRIPDDLGALMVRWIEQGTEPTPGELAALPSRQRVPRGGPKRRAEGEEGGG